MTWSSSPQNRNLVWRSLRAHPVLGAAQPPPPSMNLKTPGQRADQPLRTQRDEDHNPVVLEAHLLDPHARQAQKAATCRRDGHVALPRKPLTASSQQPVHVRGGASATSPQPARTTQIGQSPAHHQFLARVSASRRRGASHSPARKVGAIRTRDTHQDRGQRVSRKLSTRPVVEEMGVPSRQPMTLPM
jgi:hypothetical protein